MTRDIRTVNAIAGQQIEYDEIIKRIGEISHRNLGILAKIGLFDVGKALVTGTGLRVEPSSLMVVNVPAGLILQRISSLDVVPCSQITDQTVTIDTATGSPRVDIIEAQIVSATDKDDVAQISTLNVAGDAVTIAVTAIKRDIRYYLSVRKQTSTTTATAATAGFVTGTVDLTSPIDLSSKYLINVAVGEDGSFQEIDCRGGTPAATTRAEIITAINTAAGYTMASASGNFLKLEGVGTGETSKFFLKAPATDTSKDALEEIMGLSITTGYKHIYQGENEWFKLAEIDVGAATTVITTALIRNIDRRGTWASEKDDIKVFKEQIYNKQLWEQTQIIELTFMGITQQTPAGAYAGAFEAGTYGNGLYIIGGASGEIQTSPDAVNWTNRTPGSAYSGTFRDAIYSNDLDLYLLIGDSGEIQTSPDGVTWTQQTEAGAPFAGIFIGATYSSDLGLFCICGDSGEIQTSPDGVTWTAQTADASYSGQFNGATYSSNLNLLCLNGQTGEIQTSPDGVAWTKQTQAGAYSGTFYNIDYGNELFCAVGQSGEIQTSPDGITWTKQTQAGGFANIFFGIKYSNGLYAIAGDSAEIQTSPDGVTWTQQTEAGAYAGTFNEVIYGNGLFVLIGTSGGEIETTHKITVDEGF